MQSRSPGQPGGVAGQLREHRRLARLGIPQDETEAVRVHGGGGALHQRLDPKDRHRETCQGLAARVFGAWIALLVERGVEGHGRQSIRLPRVLDQGEG